MTTMTKGFPSQKYFLRVACLILPGETETDNFIGDLSQVKHLILFDGVHEESPTLSNHDSLEVRKYTNHRGKHLPMSSKRFDVPLATMEWRTLPKTLQVIKTEVNLDEYISLRKPLFLNLKIPKSLYGRSYDPNQSLVTLIKFLKDHKGSLTELSFCAEEEITNIKVLVPLLTSLQKLSVNTMTDK